MPIYMNFSNLMGDTGGLETKLQTDAQFRAAFFEDPVGALRMSGFTLSPSQQRNLISSVNRLRSNPQAMNSVNLRLGLYISATPGSVQIDL